MMNSPQKAAKAAKSNAIKTSRIYIDPDDFHLMRRRAFLTTQEAAKVLDVTHRTLQNWEKGRVRIPYTAYRVLKIKVGYLFDDDHFKDWFVRGDTLWSPEGEGFKPHELRYISHYFWMARQWLKERAAVPKGTDAANASTVKNQTFLATRVAKPAELEPLAHDEASDATASSGARLHQKLHTISSKVAGLQEKPPEFEKFLRELGITNDIGNYFS